MYVFGIDVILPPHAVFQLLSSPFQTTRPLAFLSPFITIQYCFLLSSDTGGKVTVVSPSQQSPLKEGSPLKAPFVPATGVPGTPDASL